MIKVEFYDTEFIPDGKLSFSVIVTRYRGSWVFVRHALRSTLEVPGGHIEEGETSGEAAIRELKEETGSLDFDIECIATYSVNEDGKYGYGRLYFAEVRTMGEIPAGSEIAEVILADELPENLTWYRIQPHLFRKVKMILAEKGQV
jgi:8-oxo-dGTP diphosphatase